MTKFVPSDQRVFPAGSATISDSSNPYVIAEIGHNHQGDLRTARDLVLAAATAGADAVKFEKRDKKSLFTPEIYNSPYASENAFGSTYGEHREALEFGRKEYKELMTVADEAGVDFFATAFDKPSADFLVDLDVPMIKMASGDLTNTPLLEYVAAIGKPTIVSTGGGTFEAVDEAVRIFRSRNAPVAVLQCTAGYPPRFDELNLAVITSFRDRYPDITVGYSGHDSGIAMAVAAYVLGARIIEKHFTLNRAMKGTDHAFSLEPDGMRKMVRDLRRTCEAIGDGDKKPYDSELAPLKKMGKMVVAGRNLDAGHVLTELDFEYRSAGQGSPPSERHLLVGKVLARGIEAFHPILENDLAS